jgi:hypothetical protein
LSVLVEQAAKQVASLHTAAVILAQDGQPGGWVWRFQPKRPVGTMLVVVLDVGTQVKGTETRMRPVTCWFVWGDSSVR